MQAVAKATALVLLRQAAELLLHYSPALALQHFKVSCADMPAVEQLCQHSIIALQRYCSINSSNTNTDPDSVLNNSERPANKHGSLHARKPDSSSTTWVALQQVVDHARCQAENASNDAGCVLVLCHEAAVEAAFCALSPSGAALRQLDASMLPEAAGTEDAQRQVRLARLAC